MTQYARPASDITVEAWTDEGTSFNDGNLYTSVQEVTQDGDTSRVNSTGDAGTFEVKLGTITDPEVGTGHTIHIWGKGTGSGGGEKVDVWLMEGTTIIDMIGSNWTPGRGSYADLNVTLGTLEADSITDYTDLRIRVTIDTIGGSEQFDITQIYLETPDAPSPGGEWTQDEFRIRAAGRLGDEQAINANAGVDWEAAANVSATLQPGPNKSGTVFGLRFKISGAAFSDTKTLKIQGRKNSTTWVDLEWRSHNDQSLLDTGPGPPYSIAVGLLTSSQFVDGVATTQLLTGSSFVAGTGEDDGTAAAVTLGVGDHTEIEWRIFINKHFEASGLGHVDGDYYDFRLVESDNTLLTTYSNTPRITLDYDNNYVGGTYPESIGDYGIYFASDGDAFTIIEESEITGTAKMMRRATGETEWLVVDDGNRPTDWEDLECLHIQQIGDTLYLFSITGGAARYTEFDMSTHAWIAVNQEISTSEGINQVIFGARRSDGTTICAWVDVADDFVYKVRTSGGVWDVSSTLIHAGTVNGASGVLAASDKIYLSWVDNELTIYSQSLDSSNVLGTVRTISTDPASIGGGQYWAVMAPVYWNDSGTEKVGILYQVGTDNKVYWRIISNDGAPGTEVVVTDTSVGGNIVALNSRQPAFNATVDGTTIYVAFVDEITEDLYYTVSENGAAFATAIEVQDGVRVHAVGVTFDSNMLYFLNEEPNVDDSAGYSGYTGGMQVEEVSLGAPDDDLDANSITAGPALDTPTMGQTHDLTATGITANPVMDTPTAAEIYILAATGITTTPAVDNPTITHIHDLAATGITTTPVVDNPTLTEEGEDALTATGITADPVLDTPTLAQVHALNATGITTNPAIATPTATHIHNLVPTGITTTPVVDNPTITHIHVLTATGITADPILDTPTVAEEGEDALTATGITTTPVVDTPALAQVHAFNTTGITTTPTVDTPTVTEEAIDVLTATGITTDPVMDTPAFGQIHPLDPYDIWAAAPVVGNPTITESGADNLDANDITANPVVETPATGQTHVLTATGIVTTPEVDTAAIGQIQTLDAAGIETTPVLDTPSMSPVHTLSANGITTSPVVETPSIGQVHILDAATILVSPLVGNPSIGQTHILTSSGITTTPTIGVPSWDLIEGIVTITFSAIYPEVTAGAIYPETTFNVIQPEVTFTIPLED